VSQAAALAQWFTFGIVVVAAVFAYFQVNEARETRKKLAQPNVVVFMDHNPKNWQYLDFVVKNLGETPAYSIKLTMAPPDVSPYHNNITGEDVGVTKLYIPEHIAVLAPGQEWRTVWDSAIKRKQHADRLSENDVTGNVTFWDTINHDSNEKPPYNNPIWLDPKMFRNMLRLSSVEPAEQLSEAIGKVASTLESYKAEHDGIWFYSKPGEEERRYLDERFTEAKAAHESIMRQLQGKRDA
jgi:hypothetical protein